MADQILFGSYVPTTQIYDTAQLYQLDPASPEFKELMVQLYQNFNLSSLVINTKESGLYPLQEFVTGEQLFPRNMGASTSGIDEGRGIFKRTYFVSTVASGATVNTSLGFTVGSTWQFVSISGVSTDQAAGSHKPLPYIAGAGAYVRLECNNTQFIIENQSGADLNNIIVVLKYTKE